MGTDDPWGEDAPSADMDYDPTTVIPPPPAELPPPPPSRPKSAAPPPMGSPNTLPPGPSIAEPAVAPPIQSQPKGPSFFSKIQSKIDLNRIFSTTVSSKTIIITMVSLGFLMLIVSESYANSANYSNAPDAPTTSDFDIDNDGLSTGESENYTAALQQYSDDLDEHLDRMNTHAGNAIFWGNIGSAFIVGGLVGLTFSSKAVEMSNSVRLTLLIGTIYMLAGMLGYDMPGVDAAIGFGFGG
jgi:hypothetical protein